VCEHRQSRFTNKYIHHFNFFDLVYVTRLLYDCSEPLVAADKIVTNVCSSASLGRIEWSTFSPFIGRQTNLFKTELICCLYFNIIYDICILTGRRFPWTEARVFFSGSAETKNGILAVANLWPNLEKVCFHSGPYSDKIIIDDEFLPKLKSLLTNNCWSKV